MVEFGVNREGVSGANNGEGKRYKLRKNKILIVSNKKGWWELVVPDIKL